MLTCRSRPRRLAISSFSNVPLARSTMTRASSGLATSGSQPKDEPQQSIFTTPESPWDHVFSEIEDTRRSHSRRPAKHAPTTASSKSEQQRRPFSVQRASARRPASITPREMGVFDEMFDMIFNAVGKKTPPTSTATPATHVPSVSGQAPGIGGKDDSFADMFRTLHHRTSRVRWSRASDMELDRKKETMELFNTDVELLQWVTLDLFGKAQQWEEETKRAMAHGQGKTTTETGSDKEHGFNHAIYPHLIAHAMRLFRKRYSNPWTSLAIFNHAARISTPSYVFGCTTPAYNELIRAKWQGWGDLEGVCSALEEMRANGIAVKRTTCMAVEEVRRDVGEARPGESAREGIAGRAWTVLGEAEVMRLMHRIEQLAALRRRTRDSAAHEEAWKSGVFDDRSDDGWRFDGWGSDRSRVE